MTDKPDDRSRQPRPRRPGILATAGAVTVALTVFGLTAAAVAVALTATQHSGRAGAALWIAFAGIVALVGATLGAGFVALRLRTVYAVRSASTRRSLAAVDERESTIDARLEALDSLVGGLAGQVGDLAREVTSTTERSGEAVDRSTLEAALSTSSQRTHRELRRTERDLQRQFEGALALYAELEPAIGLPPMAGWAVAPDLGAYLVRLIRRTRPEHVVEIGSGSSTVLCALALHANQTGRITSLEHDESYATVTRAWMSERGLDHVATVHHCPLALQRVGDDEMPWYTVDGLDLGTIDLLIVDGPPGATGSCARYPALPLLHHALAPGAIVVLDDAARADEQTAVERWRDGYGLTVFDTPTHVKGTAVLRVPAP